MGPWPRWPASSAGQSPTGQFDQEHARAQVSMAVAVFLVGDLRDGGVGSLTRGERGRGEADSHPGARELVDEGGDGESLTATRFELDGDRRCRGRCNYRRRGPASGVDSLGEEKQGDTAERMVVFDPSGTLGYGGSRWFPWRRDA